MKLVKIKLSREVAKHYKFEYMWKYVWRGLSRGSVIVDGGLVDESSGQIGSVPIALNPAPNNDGVYEAVIEK